MNNFDMRLVQAFGEKYQAKSGRNNAAPPIEGDICEGKRNSTLTSIAGSLRRRGIDQTAIFESLCGINRVKCKPPLSESEVRQIAKSVAGYEPRESLSVQGQGTTSRNIEPKWCLDVTVMSDVIEEEFEWLWENRIPLGEVSLVGGNPGDGKSTLSCELAAAVTNGATLIGGGQGTKGNVLIIAAEDSVSKTVKRRLRQSGADQSRVHVVQFARDEHENKRSVSLETDIPLIEDLIRQHDFKLVIIDPISAYMGKGTDTYKDSSVRHVLMPLSDLAHKTNAAIVCIKHLNKSSNNTNALYRISESIGFVGVARTVLFLGKDPDSEQRIIDVVKSNAGPKPKAIAFEIKEGRFVWIGETDMNADRVLSKTSGEADGRNKLEEAEDFLLETLNNCPRRGREIFRESRDLGISQRTLRRAKEKIGIESNRVEGVGKDGCWKWKLPDTPKVAKHVVSKTAAILEGRRTDSSLNKDQNAKIANEADTPKNAKDVVSETVVTLEGDDLFGDGSKQLPLPTG